MAVEPLAIILLGQGDHSSEAIVNAAYGCLEDTSSLAGVEAQSLGGEGRLSSAVNS